MARRRDRDDLPEWAGRDLVVLRGGVRDGRWYFAEDLRILAGSYAAAGWRWPYVETSATEPHPHYPTLTGRVHRHEE